MRRKDPESAGAQAQPSPRARQEPDGSAETWLFLLAVCFSVLAIVLLVWMIRWFWPFTVDDAYITLRYSANLAAGHGPVYNLEPPRAEGYTTFLWMVVLALPHLAGMDAVWAAKALGAVFSVATVALVFWRVAGWSDFLGPRARFLPAAVTAFWLAAYHPVAVHAVSGMETALAALLLTLLAFLASGPQRSFPVRLPVLFPVLLPVLGLLLGLTRPEANPVIAVALAISVFSAAPGVERRRFVLGALCCYVLPGAIYFAWRATYFGYLFPIPFYLKVAAQGPLPLAGSDTTLSFLRTLLVPLGFALAGCLLRMKREVVRVAGIAGLWLVTCLLPANIMDYEARFCFPAAPLLFSLAGYGLAVWLSHAARWTEAPSPLGQGGILTAVVLLVAGAGWLSFSKPHAAMAFERRSYGQALEHTHVRLGRILADLAGDRDPKPLVALGDAGALPYYSGWRVLDSFGLNDPVIGIQGNRDPAYVLGAHPDFVVLVSRRQTEYETHETVPWEGQLYEAVRAAGMKRLAVMSFSPLSHLWVMGDPESELARSLRREMRRLMAAEAQRSPGSGPGIGTPPG